MLACLLGAAASVLAQGTQPLVAVHDSELTRALESMPAAAPTPSSPGTTGFQWWASDWHYFVMPESVMEALRSDGTAFTVVRDADVSAGLLLTNGRPRYPIVISLAAEAIRDDEIAPFTNYVAAGGFLLIGSSSFTRNPDGTTRGDFALAGEMGVHMVNPGLTNWTYNSTFTKQSNHRLLNHLPDGQLTWRMPSYADEISWSTSPSHPALAPHDLWEVRPADATVLASGDTYPYLVVKPYGKGCFIYDAALQPLIGHNGFAPGMYAYVIFRKAIEWAFESARLPVPKLSPWPYPYDAAFVIRHDLENFQSEISHIEASAQYENSSGARGDYYFSTGALRQDMATHYDTNAVIASLNRAITNYGATIGPHNGGLRNPDNPALNEPDYDYWHWGPDEALDVTPPGFPSGKSYAMASISNSFGDIESWFPGLMTSAMRVWVAPYFNATREDSYDLQSQLGVKIAGEQKLTPFPHWTLSTRAAGKRYPILSEPTSDWFVGGLVAQSLEPWHPPGVHTSQTLHDAVDFYYRLGGLINFYSHTLSTGEGDAGQLVPDYISYCLNSGLHPRLWPANAIGVHQWWSRRATAQISASHSVSGGRLVTTIGIQNASDSDTAVELFVPAGAYRNLQVSLNGAPAGAGNWRTNGRTIKLLVGTVVTNAQISYDLVPAAQDDTYSTTAGTTLSVGAPGVLANDSAGSGGTLSASLAAAPQHGTLTLNPDGSFTYTPAPAYSGADSFSYVANDGTAGSDPAVVRITVNQPGVLFSDDFTSSTDPGPIAPWVAQSGSWTITGGRLAGTSGANAYGYAHYDNTNWTDYTIQARILFSSTSGLGGGIGGRLNPSTGAHYAAWIYPENSAGGPALLKLIKFEGWTTWGGTPMQMASLPGVGSNWHTVALSMQGPNLKVSYDGAQVLNVTDTNFDSVAPFTSGGISADMFSDANSFTFSVDDVLVTAAGAPPVITAQPPSATVAQGATATFSVTASGSGPLSYAWFKNGTNQLVDGGNLSGSTTATLVLSAVAQTDTGSYSVVVANSAGSVTSSQATLTVNSPQPPVIVSQPQSRSNAVGSTATFSVSARGTGPAYQWQFNGADIAGATGNNYTIASVQMNNAGHYTVIVANSAGAVTSDVATLTVFTPVPPSITAQPQSQTVIAGQNARFSVTATGTPPLAYQWQFNGVNINGATDSVYTRTNVTAADAGAYSVIVGNSYGSAKSSTATLTVNYSLAVNVNPPGSGTVLVVPNQSAYAPGSTVVLTAVPGLLKTFKNWSGSANGSLNALILTMDGNKTLTANFSALGL